MPAKPDGTLSTGQRLSTLKGQVIMSFTSGPMPASKPSAGQKLRAMVGQMSAS